MICSLVINILVLVIPISKYSTQLIKVPLIEAVTLSDDIIEVRGKPKVSSDVLEMLKIDSSVNIG